MDYGLEVMGFGFRARGTEDAALKLCFSCCLVKVQPEPVFDISS